MNTVPAVRSDLRCRNSDFVQKMTKKRLFQLCTRPHDVVFDKTLGAIVYELPLDAYRVLLRLAQSIIAFSKKNMIFDSPKKAQKVNFLNNHKSNRRPLGVVAKRYLNAIDIQKQVLLCSWLPFCFCEKVVLKSVTQKVYSQYFMFTFWFFLIRSPGISSQLHSKLGRSPGSRIKKKSKSEHKIPSVNFLSDTFLAFI